MSTSIVEQTAMQRDAGRSEMTNLATSAIFENGSIRSSRVIRQRIRGRAGSESLRTSGLEKAAQHRLFDSVWPVSTQGTAIAVLRTVDRMTVLSSKKTIFALIAAAVVITLLGMYVRRQFAIDTCLDHGGRWDYAANKCDE